MDLQTQEWIQSEATCELQGLISKLRKNHAKRCQNKSATLPESCFQKGKLNKEVFATFCEDASVSFYQNRLTSPRDWSPPPHLRTKSQSKSVIVQYIGPYSQNSVRQHGGSFDIKVKDRQVSIPARLSVSEDDPMLQELKGLQAGCLIEVTKFSFFIPGGCQKSWEAGITRSEARKMTLKCDGRMTNTHSREVGVGEYSVPVEMHTYRRRSDPMSERLELWLLLEEFEVDWKLDPHLTTQDKAPLPLSRVDEVDKSLSEIPGAPLSLPLIDDWIKAVEKLAVIWFTETAWIRFHGSLTKQEIQFIQSEMEDARKIFRAKLEMKESQALKSLINIGKKYFQSIYNKKWPVSEHFNIYRVYRTLATILSPNSSALPTKVRYIPGTRRLLPYLHSRQDPSSSGPTGDDSREEQEIFTQLLATQFPTGHNIFSPVPTRTASKSVREIEGLVANFRFGSNELKAESFKQMLHELYTSIHDYQIPEDTSDFGIQSYVSEFHATQLLSKVKIAEPSKKSISRSSSHKKRGKVADNSTESSDPPLSIKKPKRKSGLVSRGFLDKALARFNATSDGQSRMGQNPSTTTLAQEKHIEEPREKKILQVKENKMRSKPSREFSSERHIRAEPSVSSNAEASRSRSRVAPIPREAIKTSSPTPPQPRTLPIPSQPTTAIKPQTTPIKQEPMDIEEIIQDPPNDVMMDPAPKEESEDILSQITRMLDKIRTEQSQEKALPERVIIPQEQVDQLASAQSFWPRPKGKLVRVIKLPRQGSDNQNRKQRTVRYPDDFKPFNDPIEPSTAGTTQEVNGKSLQNKQNKAGQTVSALQDAQDDDQDEDDDEDGESRMLDWSQTPPERLKTPWQSGADAAKEWKEYEEESEEDNESVLDLEPPPISSADVEISKSGGDAMDIDNENPAKSTTLVKKARNSPPRARAMRFEGAFDEPPPSSEADRYSPQLMRTSPNPTPHREEPSSPGPSQILRLEEAAQIVSSGQKSRQNSDGSDSDSDSEEGETATKEIVQVERTPLGLSQKIRFRTPHIEEGDGIKVPASSRIDTKMLQQEGETSDRPTARESSDESLPPRPDQVTPTSSPTSKPKRKADEMNHSPVKAGSSKSPMIQRTKTIKLEGAESMYQEINGTMASLRGQEKESVRAALKITTTKTDAQKKITEMKEQRRREREAILAKKGDQKTAENDQ